jgi:biotin carboxylase
MGLKTIAVDGDARAPGLAAADLGVQGNILDPGEMARVARENRVSGIYPAAELGVESAAEATAELGLPGVVPEVATRVRNKLAMRQALEAAGLPGPAFRGVSSIAEAERAVLDIGLPVIIKPADGNASKGVRRVGRIGEIVRAFEPALAQSRIGTVLIEAFMEGEEFNVDGLVFDGEYTLGGLTAKDLSPSPNRFDLGIYMPPLACRETMEEVVNTVVMALNAIGFDSGVTHAEVMVTEAGPRIVEMAGRPGGGRIPTDLIPLTYGMDFMADSIRIVMGEPPTEVKRFERGAALYWIPAEPGTVSAIEGIEEARAVSGVREVVIDLRPGDVVEPIVDCVSRDRIGYVMTTGDTAELAVAAAKQARDLCNVVTRTA